MKERPILFNGENVRRILAGTKTQTRRVIRPQPREGYRNDSEFEAGDVILLGDELCKLHSPKRGSGPASRGELYRKPHLCPYGVPGDRLWVRETWAVPPKWDSKKPSELADLRPCGPPIYRASHESEWRWRSSIFMPRWASRILLEVAGVRVERLQDITPHAAKAEGVSPHYMHPWGASYIGYVSSFVNSWDALNAKRGYGWAANPWVWVIEFKKKGD